MSRSWHPLVRIVVRGLPAMCLACGAWLVLLAAPAGAATVVSESAVARIHNATLEASINPEGHDTTCQVQYLTEGEYEQKGWTGAPALPCSPEDLGSGSSNRVATVALSGLEISTTYRYRFLTSSEGASVPGPQETFATFGIAQFSLDALNELEEPFTQAAGHPFELTAYIAANTTEYKAKASPDAILKDALTQLPPGLVGNPDAMVRCPGRIAEENRCTAASEVGTITVYHGTTKFGPKPLFDVIPPEGTAARFAGEINISTDAYIDASIRSGSDYGVSAGGYNITALANATAFQITFWGVPNASDHNPERWCLKTGEAGYRQGCAAEGEPRPFLSMPTACDGPQSATAALDSYAAPGEYVSSTAQMPTVTGCDAVGFNPEIEAQPTSRTADSPTGLSVDLRIPQEENPEKYATADLKDAVVTFPAGLTVDPSSVEGLSACSEAQVGFTGFAELNETSEPGVETAQFTPSPAECPDASKLGTVEIDTPLVEHPLPGALYLAKQGENPFGSVLALYLTAYDPISGVVVKLPGRVEACESTGQVLASGVTCAAPGQLTTVFDQNPQLPFEDLKIELFPGPRAALTTPLTCGSYATSANLTPWTAPEAADATPASEPFVLSAAPGGEACASSEAQAPNSPGFDAGTASPVAGAYSPFVLNLTREDGSQRFASLNVTLPPGLTGKVVGVEECPQGDIEAAQRRSREGEGALEQSNPSCPTGSEVGTVHVGVGSGSPFVVGGRAYFAGPYEGAPFSLVIVTPAIAGPFDLGTIVVRAALDINPTTAQVTVKSDPFPTILDGIPLDVRTLAVEISRSDFMLNPTSCEVMAVAGEETSTAEQAASLSDRFQAGGCASLKFSPRFAVSTSGKTSKLGGAGLHVSLSYPAGSLGAQANVHEVKVDLPEKLPSRGTTLRQACLATQFEADPAGCPAGSVVGHAKAVTPILPVALEGPAYFVSHGGEAFPNLTVVLQGDGVTVELVGDTFISKAGITSSTFKTVPDVPVSDFELTLPEGPDSALAANGNLCASPMTMPTEMVAQDGAVIRQDTHVDVEGCSNTLAVLSKSVKDETLTLHVAVPAAGRLKASGTGLISASRSSGGRGTVTLRLRIHLTAAQRTTLERHPGRKIVTRVKLQFALKTGKRLAKTLAAKL